VRADGQSVVPESLPPLREYVELGLTDQMKVVFEVPHLNRATCLQHDTPEKRAVALVHGGLGCPHCEGDVEWEATYGPITLDPLPPVDNTGKFAKERRAIFAYGLWKATRHTVRLREGIPPVSVKRVPFELGFAITFNKVQGQTLPKVILCFDESTYPQGINFESVYVGISRVRNEKDMRIWPISRGEGMANVFTLKRPPNLSKWESTKGIGVTSRKRVIEQPSKSSKQKMLKKTVPRVARSPTKRSREVVTTRHLPEENTYVPEPPVPTQEPLLGTMSNTTDGVEVMGSQVLAEIEGLMECVIRLSGDTGSRVAHQNEVHRLREQFGRDKNLLYLCQSKEFWEERAKEIKRLMGHI